MLDNTLEFMVMNGMDLPLAVMVTIPEPWSNNEYHGPARSGTSTSITPRCWSRGTAPPAILFSDGDVMGAVLDRNGLRPSRYYHHQRRPSDPFQ